MIHPHSPTIAALLSLRTAQVDSVLQLFEEGATVPFIARYRKDRTGALDEVAIQRIRDEAKRLQDLLERREAIVKSITEQGKMTDEVRGRLDKAETLTELEDIYLPFKPKRKTRASVARENGLEPLAMSIREQDASFDPEEAAKAFLNETVTSADDALKGARDILAEVFSEDTDTRSAVRGLFERKAHVIAKVAPGKETEATKFRDYFDFSEPVAKIPSHRTLAVLRGFLEGFLWLSIEPEEEEALALLERMHMNGSHPSGLQVRKALRDAYKRLLQPSLETEMRTMLKQKAEEDAIDVFSENLRQLLLSSPLGGKPMLSIDPGYRTGCKVVVLDAKGDLQHASLIYIHEPGRLSESERVLRDLIRRFSPSAIAIGDGTGGRETEGFIKGLGLGIPLYLVNEDGASVYSASEAAREEFPEQDITVRGAISIGRRLMDPLAELVKIDPKSIGVGQYQHDVNQFRLKERLDRTVVSCVNQVGVNLNTASRHLLAYVSGINSGVADQIVNYRKEAGRFADRRQLLKVPRLGEKAFEQCAGFLRITDGVHPLDASAVHPEAYYIVERMAADLGLPLASLIGNEEQIARIRPEAYVDEKFGLITVKDILSELRKPGLDPRDEIRRFEFAGIYKMEDVKEGMVVPGIVTNLTRFGAFVDIGVKQDGLVHVSEISYTYVSDPSAKLKLNQQVMVKVLEVDLFRKRIALSIRQAMEEPREQRKRPENPGRGGAAREEAPRDMDSALSDLKRKFGRR